MKNSQIYNVNSQDKHVNQEKNIKNKHTVLRGRGVNNTGIKETFTDEILGTVIKVAPSRTRPKITDEKRSDPK